MTPMHPTDVITCPNAPLLKRNRRNASLNHKEQHGSGSFNLCLPPSIVLDPGEALLPRALFAKHPSRGAHMVRAALSMDMPSDSVF